MSHLSPDLTGRVALVSGATRGAGRGIATELGACGATVYVTGRTTVGSPSPMQRPETIEETAELVNRAGGRGIAVPMDHSDLHQVRSLVDKVGHAHGRLDLLVNNIWGGDPFAEWGVPFWEHDLERGLQLVRNAVETHIITSWYLAPLLIRTPRALVIEITDGIDPAYRGSLFYDLAKASAIRLAVAQAAEFKPHDVTAIALTPGFLRSEAMLAGFGVTEDSWREGIARDRHFAASETPHYVGRAVAHLAADPNVIEYTGTATATWKLYEKYKFTDIDGTSPDWGRYAEENL